MQYLGTPMTICLLRQATTQLRLEKSEKGVVFLLVYSRCFNIPFSVNKLNRYIFQIHGPTIRQGFPNIGSRELMITAKK